MLMLIEEEQKTLLSGLDPDINLCQDLMSGSHVRISCRDLMSGSDVHFSVGFPVFTVKYFSIFGNLYLSLPFSVRFPVFVAKHFSKLEFCIYQCFSGLDFLMNFLI